MAAGESAGDSAGRVALQSDWLRFETATRSHSWPPARSRRIRTRIVADDSAGNNLSERNWNCRGRGLRRAAGLVDRWYTRAHARLRSHAVDRSTFARGKKRVVGRIS